MKAFSTLLAFSFLFFQFGFSNASLKNFADLEIICSNDTVIATDESSCGRVFQFGVPEVITSVGSVDFTLVSGMMSGSVFPEGNVVQTWQAIDSVGNTVLCSYLVTVIDTIGPELLCPISISAIVNDNCEYEIVDVAELSFISDNCQISLVEQSPQIGAVSGSTTLVELSVTDDSGNISQCFMEIIANDTIAPVVQCPEDQTLPVLVDCMSSLPNYLIDAEYSDNCASNLLVSQSPEPGSLIQTSTIVMLEVMDIYGNSNSCAFYAMPAPLDNSITVEGSTISSNQTGAIYQWVDCNGPKPLPIAGEVAQSFTPTESGSYALWITQGNCTMQSECVDMVISNLFEIADQNNFNVYPNPTNGFVTIALKEPTSTIMNLRVLDVLGQVVYSNEISTNRAFTMNLSFLPKGNYIITATSENSTHQKRVVLQ